MDSPLLMGNSNKGSSRRLNVVLPLPDMKMNDSVSDCSSYENEINYEIENTNTNSNLNSKEMNNLEEQGCIENEIKSIYDDTTIYCDLCEQSSYKCFNCREQSFNKNMLMFVETLDNEEDKTTLFTKDITLNVDPEDYVSPLDLSLIHI